MECPVDHAALGAGGVCPKCQGAYLEAHELRAKAPEFLARLVVETDERSGAFAKIFRCPSCAGPMAPWHFDRMMVWIDRCASCEGYWLDAVDLEHAVRINKQLLRQAAVASMPEADKREMAEALAESEKVGRDEISPQHRLLALFGLPVITGIKRVRTPFASWSIALVLIVIAIVDAVMGEQRLAMAMALDARHLSPISAVTSVFAHDGWLHLLGNVYFLLAFGDAVEQRVPRWALVSIFVFGGAAACFVDAAFETSGVVLGASGGIAVLMGMCLRLQPKAKVVTGFFGLFAARLPMTGYIVLELAYQLGMLMFGVGGTAWLAHLSGLLGGLVIGEIARRR